MSKLEGIWEATASAIASPPSLEVSLDTEVAIVGAGFTGLSTALHLADKGVRTVLLEAQMPGSGASGRNAGWMAPDWWMKKPGEILAKFGAQGAERLTRWVASGPQKLAEWVQRFGMAIELNRSGLLLVTDQQNKAAQLPANVEAWQKLGLSMRFLKAGEIAEQVDSKRYLAGIFLPEGATINPLALSRELARVCLEKGIQLFAHSPVEEISRSGVQWQLRTPRGEVRARRLVLATDAYTRELWPELSHSLVNWRLAVLGTEPYPALGTLLPTGRPFGDMGMANMFTLRAAGGGRLVTSTFAPLRSAMSPAEVAMPFMRKFRTVFPHYPAPKWRYVHYGEVGLSRDMLPRLCTIGEQAWTAYGYSGNGVNMSLLMGRELAQLAAGANAQESAFPLTRLEPLPLRAPMGFALKYLHAPLARGVLSRVA